MIDLNKIYTFLETGGNKFNDTSKKDLSIDLIREEFKELILANSENDIQKIKDAIGDLFFVIMNNAYFNGITVAEIEDIYRKIYISNMSKFCISLDEAIQTVEAYENGTHWDKLGTKIKCYFDTVGNFFVVKRQDGKILKSINYKPVKTL